MFHPSNSTGVESNAKVTLNNQRVIVKGAQIVGQHYDLQSDQWCGHTVKTCICWMLVHDTWASLASLWSVYESSILGEQPSYTWCTRVICIFYLYILFIDLYLLHISFTHTRDLQRALTCTHVASIIYASHMYMSITIKSGNSYTC